jgi:hypothetical protein
MEGWKSWQLVIFQVLHVSGSSQFPDPGSFETSSRSEQWALKRMPNPHHKLQSLKYKSFTRLLWRVQWRTYYFSYRSMFQTCSYSISHWIMGRKLETCHYERKKRRDVHVKLIKADLSLQQQKGGGGRVQGSWWNCGWMEPGVDLFAVPIGVNQTPNGITALSIHMLYFMWIVSLWLYVPIFSLCTDMNLGPAQQVQQLICIWIMALPKAVEVFLSIIRDCSLCMQMPNVASRRPCLWREI